MVKEQNVVCSPDGGNEQDKPSGLFAWVLQDIRDGVTFPDFWTKRHDAGETVQEGIRLADDGEEGAR